MKSYNYFLFFGTILFALIFTKPAFSNTIQKDSLLITNQQITLKAAIVLADNAKAFAKTLNKEVAIAIVDAGGNILLINRDNSTGPHNADAARLKAYTSMSTKTATLILGRNAKSNPDTQNLATVSGLLLLGGGLPIFNKGKLIGAIGIAGGGGPEGDHNIANYAVLQLLKTQNTKN